jgi:hypothetical protein
MLMKSALQRLGGLCSVYAVTQEAKLADWMWRSHWLSAPRLQMEKRFSRIALGKVFYGPEIKWHTFLLPVFHWLDISHKGTYGSKGSWEMQRSRWRECDGHKQLFTLPQKGLFLNIELSFFLLFCSFIFFCLGIELFSFRSYFPLDSLPEIMLPTQSTLRFSRWATVMMPWVRNSDMHSHLQGTSSSQPVIC